MKKLALLSLIVLLSSFNLKTNQTVSKKTFEIKQEPTEWVVFIKALIDVESAGNTNAVGKTNDVGVLQITPIFVKEANRILGTNKYDLKSRKDRSKSLEMFAVIQNFHNPDYNIEKAIRLHNPGAPKQYREKILRKIKLIKQKLQTNEIQS